jgi:hypothetical protein
MSDKIQNSEIKKEGMSPFDYFTEVIGWLQIAAFPLLLGLLAGACIYFSDPTTVRLVIGIGVVITGLITGIVFATRVWNKKGTVYFVSREMASPELDNLEEDKK